MKVETRARARVLQALYAWDMRGKASLETVAAKVWDDLAIAPDERHLAVRLVRAIARDSKLLDREIASVTTNWRLERIGAIERSVLRLAAAELKFFAELTPPRVVIKEAVRLAERFGSAESASFVNGVLDAFARRAGLLS